MGNKWNARLDKHAILHAIVVRSLTARDAADLFDVNRHTVEKWCKAAGISLAGHKHPRVAFILRKKVRKLERLLRELAVIQREVKALRGQDPAAAYIPARKKSS